MDLGEMTLKGNPTLPRSLHEKGKRLLRSSVKCNQR